MDNISPHRIPYSSGFQVYYVSAWFLLRTQDIFLTSASSWVRFVTWITSPHRIPHSRLSFHLGSQVAYILAVLFFYVRTTLFLYLVHLECFITWITQLFTPFHAPDLPFIVVHSETTSSQFYSFYVVYKYDIILITASSWVFFFLHT